MLEVKQDILDAALAEPGITPLLVITQGTVQSNLTHARRCAVHQYLVLASPQQQSGQGTQAPQLLWQVGDDVVRQIQFGQFDCLQKGRTVLLHVGGPWCHHACWSMRCKHAHNS